MLIYIYITLINGTYTSLAPINCNIWTPPEPYPKAVRVWILGSKTLLFGYLDPLGYNPHIDKGVSEHRGP